MVTIARFLNRSLAAVEHADEFAQALNRETSRIAEMHGAGAVREIPGGITWGSDDHAHAYLDAYGNRWDIVIMKGSVADAAKMYAAAGIEQ